MNRIAVRWLLAFDASCGTCKGIAHAVGRACRGRLEMPPLADAEVRRLREKALGPGPEWAPTLLHIDGDRVRAWTGAAMALPLGRRLGPAGNARVVHRAATPRTTHRPAPVSPRSMAARISATPENAPSTNSVNGNRPGCGVFWINPRNGDCV